MLQKLSTIQPLIGHTPLVQLESGSLPVDLFVKLEYTNYSGSIKDRPAFHMLQEAIYSGAVTSTTTIVESSSGNFAIALASLCQRLGLNFIPVIDPNINPIYESQLTLLCRQVVKVDQVDYTGGYLLSRIEAVKSICQQPDTYWTNQYENPNNYLSYYKGLGPELCAQLPTLDYAFIGVSSAGTITGLSRKLKERYPHIRVVAVDVEGSIIFGNAPKPRYISGIGASKVPPVLQHAAIDEVIHVPHADIIAGSRALLTEQMIFGGASTGAVYWAIKNYPWQADRQRKPTVLFLCTDKGTAYLDTVYNEPWAQLTTEKSALVPSVAK
ncbi:2,3-diaminopropionate biosynthesis protein SbnA [Fibrella aquatilis]|uniref:2,3-diaminopropionate biosynthesis protein SbnA n=1 Tax=Fibrella aquatilis TaxID=2817059 RepID=A0A939K2R4_9BACT|nr:2,3-diaminopropionate biosynthesis protein SbnA [Fibrella aquatilis]MBO0933580.1 2,3-diaminopropionate biosynthesis protein SbnA [Fibrella aquatilis]